MSAMAELISTLITAGMNAADAAALVARAVVELAPPKDQRSPGAKRQAAYRERNKASRNVTDVMHNESVTERNATITKRNKRDGKRNKSDASLRHASRASLSYLLPSNLSSFIEEPLKERKKEVVVVTRARGKRPLPDDWKPPDRAAAVAKQFGSDVAQVEQIFRDYLASSGKLYVDHDAAFCNFLRNQRNFSRGNGHEKPRSAIIQAADDLCRKIAEFDGPEQIRDETRPHALRLLSNR